MKSSKLINNNRQVVILAGGKGSRMNSSVPKPLQLVKNTPMLDGIMQAALLSTPDVILVHSDALTPYLDKYSKSQLALQSESLGTAHAVFCALKKIKKDSFVTIAYADHPFIDNIIIDKMFETISCANYSYSCLIMASIQEQENTYGRIITKGPEVLEIIEYRNLSQEQKAIKLCNSALMSFAPGILHTFLPEIFLEERLLTDEYYLTKIVKILSKSARKVSYIINNDSKYSLGVNTKKELEQANQLIF
jgi:UDP-N-acetylglucosamine pyrophosphorylase